MALGDNTAAAAATTAATTAAKNQALILRLLEFSRSYVVDMLLTIVDSR